MAAEPVSLVPPVALPSPAGAPRSAWLPAALLTTGLWGVWGALCEVTERLGVTAPLSYVAWALSFVPALGYVYRRAPESFVAHRKAITLGLLGGLPACAGNLALFVALGRGPAYLVFPLVSLYPLVTVAFSLLLLRERGSPRIGVGVVLAVAAGLLLSWQPGAGGADASAGSFLFWALLALFLWGAQAYCWKIAEPHLRPETLFLYLGVSAWLLVPVALTMTDLGAARALGGAVSLFAVATQALNTFGALLFAYALRKGRALVVVPLTALAPTVTVLISLAWQRHVPESHTLAGIAVASVAAVLLAE